MRQRCGFGCIICGSIIIEYEHIKPEFHEAKVHDPNKITLLCPKCHAKVTKGLITKEEIIEYNKNPFCKRKGIPKETFLESTKKIHEILFCGINITNCLVPIQVKDTPLIKIERNSDGIFLLTANFFNSKGKKSLEIYENEWKLNVDNWDFELKSNNLIIKDNQGKISLKIEILPPSKLLISKIDMKVYNYHFKGQKNEIEINGIKFSDVNISNGNVGLYL